MITVYTLRQIRLKIFAANSTTKNKMLLTQTHLSILLHMHIGIQ